MTASGPDHVLSPGTGTGELLVLDAPVSFWGGVDGDGRVVEHRHPQYGVSLTDRVVAMSAGKGSSSSSSVLAELIRGEAGPAAIVLGQTDLILALGALVAGELYARWMPVVVTRSPLPPVPPSGLLRVHAPVQGRPLLRAVPGAAGAPPPSTPPRRRGRGR